MPYYKPILYIDPQEKRARTLEGLKRLRRQLAREMPEKSNGSSLVLGTWNIRNFDDNRFANGHRTEEDLYYIAEIISRFDVLAVQELCEDTQPLERLLYYLGKNYDYIITDVTEGQGGNDERLGFIFDTNKVRFMGIAGELVLPPNMLIQHEERELQFARTPFMCFFQAGWFKFKFSTVHIYFGEASGAKYKRRVSEIDKVADFLSERAEKDSHNHILVGDFNIVKEGSDGYNALKKHGFEIYQNKMGSNKDQTKFYDQISFKVRENQLQFTHSEKCKGVLQFFDSIYREEDFGDYVADLKKTIRVKIKRLGQEIEEKEEKLKRARSEKSRERHRKSIEKKKEAIIDWEDHLVNDELLKSYYLSEWRTFHGSDHLPLWVELDVDFSDEYLEYLSSLQK